MTTNKPPAKIATLYERFDIRSIPKKPPAPSARRRAKVKRKGCALMDWSSPRKPALRPAHARLLGMLLVKDIKKKTDQVPLLRTAGFEVSEVAEMLGMTDNHVKVADHHGRKKRTAG